MERSFRFWELRKARELLYLDFSGWPGVRVLYSTRMGGVSPPPFDSLNLHFGRGDTRQCVDENRRRFFRAVGVDERQIVMSKQIHSSMVQEAKSGDRTLRGDGMITDHPGIFLGVFTADCPGIFLFAPHAHAIGVIHAGRRGLAASIVEKGVRVLCDTYQADPGSVEALCGPSIGPCCYEIGEEVRHLFAAKYVAERGGKLYLDLWSIAADQLARAGIKKAYMSRVCSVDHSDLFFSYRRSGEKVGENLGLIGMIPR